MVSRAWLTSPRTTLLLFAFLFAACEEKGLQSDSSDSSLLPPRSVTINWTPSSAKQVAEAGGGYLLYVAPTSSALASAVPIQISNPGNGTHITSSTTQLKPGTYNFAIKAYSADSTSELSGITNITVPQ